MHPCLSLQIRILVFESCFTSTVDFWFQYTVWIICNIFLSISFSLRMSISLLWNTLSKAFSYSLKHRCRSTLISRHLCINTLKAESSSLVPILLRFFNVLFQFFINPIVYYFEKYFKMWLIRLIVRCSKHSFADLFLGITNVDLSHSSDIFPELYNVLNRPVSIFSYSTIEITMFVICALFCDYNKVYKTL